MLEGKQSQPSREFLRRPTASTSTAAADGRIVGFAVRPHDCSGGNERSAAGEQGESRSAHCRSAVREPAAAATTCVLQAQCLPHRLRGFFGPLLQRLWYELRMSHLYFAYVSHSLRLRREAAAAR